MQLRGRKLRFVAVLACVVLALTGFSRGHGRHGHGSGGGGCSSSHQDHDSSSSSSTSGGSSYDTGSSGSSYGSDDDGDSGYGSSIGGGYTRRPTHRATSTPSGGSSSPLEDGTAKLISCATAKKPYATVEVTNPNNREGTFSVDVSFRDRSDTEVDYGYEYATVPAKGRMMVTVKPDSGNADLIDHCRVEPEADAD